MRVQVCFWFDVEDYITPESDVALGRLIDIFDRHGLKATFKMVGEKVRGLQQRGHNDILKALRGSTTSAITPTITAARPVSPSTLLSLDWESGIEAFAIREQAGLETLKKAFDRFRRATVNPAARGRRTSTRRCGVGGFPSIWTRGRGSASRGVLTGTVAS